MATVKGTSKSETKVGTNSSDLIYGYAGNDSLYGRSGDDKVWGGTGFDILFGEAGNDILRGEGGGDSIYGGIGNDTLYGDAGDDKLHGDAGNDTLYGGDGRESISGGAGKDKLYSGTGDDFTYGGLDSDSLFGEAGNDFLSGEDANDFIYGSDGNDMISGGAGDDMLYGDAGTDFVFGDAGNDTLKGGRGTSTIYGGDGDDSLYFNPTSGDVSTLSTSNWGEIPGGMGTLPYESTLSGGAGTDTLNIFNEATYAKDGKVSPTLTLVGVTGSDSSGDISFISSPATGWSGTSAGKFNGTEKIIVTGTGGLYFNGYSVAGKGVDVTGTASADTFYSHQASDTMRGGAGNDKFYSYGGTDTMISLNTDADQFTFNGYTPSSAKITGFNGAGDSGGDVIKFEFTSPEALSVYPVSGGTRFEVDILTGPSAGQQSNVTVDAVGLVAGQDYFFL